MKRVLLDRMPLIYVFMSGIGFSIQTLMIKLLSEGGFRGSYHCVFSRGVIQLVIASCFVIWDRLYKKREDESQSLFGDTNYVRFIMVMRSVVGYFSIAFSFLSAEYIPIGDSTVLVMLSPIVAAIASFFILGEPWSIAEFVGTILSITGAVLVAKPPFLFGSNVDTGNVDPKDFYLGVSVSLFAAICAGFAFVLVRMLGTSAKMPWANVCVVQAIGQIVLSVPSLYIAGQTFIVPVTLLEIGMIFVVGFVGAWSQIAMTLGMQREKSAAASAMRMSDVVFGFIWQVLFTADDLNLLSLFGAIIVASSILVIVIFKANNSPSAATDKIKPMSAASSRSQGYEVVSALEVDDQTDLEDEADNDTVHLHSKRRRRGLNESNFISGLWFKDVFNSSGRLTLTNLISKSLRHTMHSRGTKASSSKPSLSSQGQKDDDEDELVEIELR